MMFEWYSMLAKTRRPARLQALAKTSAEALMPLPWGPPIIQESRFFCIRKSYSNLRMSTRRERDTLGEVSVPEDALYGAQTGGAVDNFPISGFHAFPAFIRATVLVKKAAAMANADSGRLPQDLCRAIVAACDEVLAGKHLDQFVVDVFQAGAGTSHNMNANEVIANRANEILGAGKRGEYAKVNPNDHVNMAQSTNDVTPTAIRLALLDLTTPLSAELEKHAARADRALEHRQRHPAQGRGPAPGIRGAHPARRAARLVDHARQGEPVDRRDGRPGLLPGHRQRHRRDARCAGRPARAEGDDARHEFRALLPR